MNRCAETSAGTGRSSVCCLGATRQQPHSVHVRLHPPAYNTRLAAPMYLLYATDDLFPTREHIRPPTACLARPRKPGQIAGVRRRT